MAQLRRLEGAAVKTPPPAFVEWPTAVTEFLLRNIEFAIVHTPPDEPSKEFILPVANGCLVGDDCVLTSSEALEFAMHGAAIKRGRLVILLPVLVRVSCRARRQGNRVGNVQTDQTGRGDIPGGS